jgi:hypothetical protein
MWLRVNHKTLGELLDDGYLTRGRLEWAATKAFNPRLRQAAQILLNPRAASQAEATPHSPASTVVPEEARAPIHLPVSIKQARAVVWPFSPFKGEPMGALVDSRQLSLKDLGYAAEVAWDDRVRKASSTLMLLRLSQAVQEPAPSAGFLRVISGGRSYAERQQFRLTLIQGLTIGAGLSAGVFFLVATIVRQASRPAGSRTLSEVASSPSGLLALLIIAPLALGAGFLLSRLFEWVFLDRLDKKVENHRRGQKGEELTTDVIRQVLDGNWTLFRNIVLPGRNRADLDIVLVGPPGVWVLEVKNLVGQYRNIGEQWEYRAGRRWHRAMANPSRQARSNAIRLAEFLRADGIRQWITAAVVWANQESPVAVENPMVAVWMLNRLSDELGNVWHGQELSEAKRKQVVEKLAKLCQNKGNKRS